MSEEPTGSQTHWIRELQAGGDGQIQQQLWDVYFQSLVRMARQKLGAAPRLVADEEDVALDALNTFFRRVKQGEFPDLKDRRQLSPTRFTRLVSAFRWCSAWPASMVWMS